uniref:PHD-finger n=1 Tax=Ascaris lumbricoides TaxID=6252 RepID=A0A0M3HF40_ASCLU
MNIQRALSELFIALFFSDRRLDSRTARRDDDFIVEHSPTRYSLNDDDIDTSREHFDLDVIHERSPTDAGRYFLRGSASDERNNFLHALPSFARKRSGTSTSESCSSDDEGISGEDGSSKRKKFYIVTNGDRPSELYRTDLIRHLKKEEYQDSSSDDETPPMRLTDRWREEWNHVQEPLSTTWPEFVVYNKPSSSSDATSCRRPFRNSEKLIAVHDAPYVDDRFERVQMPPLISYQCDRLDLIYLEGLNEKRREMGLPPIAEKVFCEVIDRFEVDTYKAIHHDLLAPLASPTPFQAEFDEDAFCDICRQTDYEEDDEIIFCDGCNVGVHQSCYGLDSVPHDDWLCHACTLLGYKAQPRCALCPLTGGAMKCMKGGKTWAHVVCALWIPEVRFGDVDHREPITNISDIPNERWALRCSICDTKQGACIQCSVKSCTTAFHVTCGLRKGQVMKIEHDSSVDDGVRMVSLCEKHSRETHGTNDNSIVSSGCTEKVTKCEEPCKELRDMESLFFLYVSPEEVANSLNVALEMVDDIYEYWKMKRIDNANRTLLDDVSEVEFQLSSQQKNSGTSSMLSFKVQNETKLRQDLEKARNLCYMVSRREKLKKEITTCCEEAFVFVNDAVADTEVPLSTRTLSRYYEAASVYAALGGQETARISLPSPSKHKSAEKVERSLHEGDIHRRHQTSIPVPDQSVIGQSTNMVDRPTVLPVKFTRRTSLHSSRLTAAPDPQNKPLSAQHRPCPQKIRERNGPDSPRRLPSQRISAIKANLTLDLTFKFPSVAKRLS